MGVSLVAAAVPSLARVALADVLASRQGTERILIESLGMLLAGLGWDVLAGAMVPAAAVLLTAAWSGAPARPLGEVFLRLALPYAGIAVFLTFGFQLVVPGIVVALGVLLCFDPVARAEQGESGFSLPEGSRVLPLLGLGTLWLLLAAGWTVLEMFALPLAVAPLETAARFVWKLLSFGGFVAWCEILRRFPREAAPGA